MLAIKVHEPECKQKPVLGLDCAVSYVAKACYRFGLLRYIVMLVCATILFQR